MVDEEAIRVPSAAAYGDTLDRVAGDLEAVDAAMHRLDEGSYGVCRQCRGDIPEQELRQDPLATACSEHAGTASI